jgi:flagellar biosynthesis/type III secretory pathway M-ring protein FliF/YscJ
MNTTNIWIVIAAIVAVLLIVALVVAAVTARRRRRERHAEKIREQARLETTKVERREALAQETAAKARAAQAEAEVKAAEAARLQDRAAKHRSDAATSREQLQDQWDRADSLDPKARADARETGDRTASDRDSAWSEAHATDAEIPRQDASVNYRDADNYR